MRSTPLIVIALVLAAPLAASLSLGAPRAHGPAALSGVPFDPTDAQLLALLGAEVGVVAPAQLPVTIAPGDTLEAAIVRLGARAGVALAPADVTAFSSLDERVALPMLTLVVATERSWDLFDVATRDLTDEEVIELIVAARVNGERDPRALQLASEVDPAALLAAGILLSDTVENIVLPELRAAADAGVWPANAIADPVGVIRIGGTGNDVENVNRVIQVDARGDDHYYNNAGATTMTNQLFGQNDALVPSPIALSLDLSGNDHYRMNYSVGAQGSGELGLGFGYMFDLDGDDEYWCSGFCQGSAFGVHRDVAGSDFRSTPGGSMGSGFLVMHGILRDDRGSDEYHTRTGSGGYASFPRSIGLLWDRAGIDRYTSLSGFPLDAYGWGAEGGRGWLVDEGDDEDYFAAAYVNSPTYRHGCNDCQWTAGNSVGSVPGYEFQVHGRGNDNAGGLPVLLFDQDPLTSE